MNLPDALRSWGVTVVEVDGWQNRGWSASKSGQQWNPRGVVCHHTANGGYRGVDAPSLNVCINGRPPSPAEPKGLAGPLCQVVLGYSGTAYVIAGKGANHAGAGGWMGLTGNASVWGIEAENNGVGEPWPQVQLDAYIRCCAALAELSGFDARFVCGHKEWTRTKIDPAGIDMGEFRAKVAAALTAGHTPSPTPQPPEDDMAGTWHRWVHEGQGAQYAVLEQGDAYVGKVWLHPDHVALFTSGAMGPFDGSDDFANNAPRLDALPWLGTPPQWTNVTTTIDAAAVAAAVVAQIPPTVDIDATEVARAVGDELAARIAD